jgi:glycosyltransferase involved in cell wall biosynthesis
MDADLQYDPQDIPRLVNAILDGNDAVNGLRVDRKDGLSKRVSSRIFNSMAKLTFDLNVRDFNSGLKAFKREVLEDVDLKGDYHRYILAAAKANGYKVSEIPIAHFPRKFGESKYGFKRLLLGSSDLLSLKLETALSKRPMVLFGSLSILCFALGLSAGIYSISTGGIELRPALLLSIGFIVASIQFLSIGFLADLLVALRDKNGGSRTT